MFNIDQTNLKEARPEMYDKIAKGQKTTRPEDRGEEFSFEPVDRMINENLWICPIKPTYGDEAYFSISKKIIVVPEKKQFVNDESFYTNLFHEMAHSTGTEGYLNRLKPSSFGSKEYAREELVAELTAALTAQRYGMKKNIKDDSAAYLKSWLNSLREEPSFIKSVLLDVKKAARMISMNIETVEKMEIVEFMA